MPGQVFSVGPNRANIAYLDSGVPPKTDAYTTLLMVHGFLWNGGQHFPNHLRMFTQAILLLGVFQKVIDNAASYHIRAIAINRRGYKDSSPFTPEELAPLVVEASSPEDSRKFMKGQAVELAEFIKHLVDNKMVSPRNNEQGGITLLGYSLGNAYILDFLSHVSTLPDELSTLVKTYVRGYIVFGEPGYSDPGLRLN
jgi:pimeloyl-ACP methyl ester carboxylesterase